MPKAIGALAEIKKKYEEIYIMKDPYVIKALYAHYVTFQLDSDPVWLILTGPSGGLKSALIGSLATCKYVHPISTITANTFVSGAQLGKGKPASMLLKLSENYPEMKGNGIISFKDMTSLISEQDSVRSILMGQLREIYDGKYDKQFGTGFSVNWEGKVTIIAGSTHSIHRMRQQYSAMGERFMFYDLIQPDRSGAGMKSVDNSESGEMIAMREMLAETSRVYLNETIEIPEKLPPISQELKVNLVALAEMATRARSDVVRDMRSPQRDIVEVNPPEMPTRFVAGLITMARALMILNHNEIGSMDLLEEDKKILYKISLDSITPRRRQAMVELSKYNVLETKGLAVKLDLPTSSLRRSVEELVALGIARRERGSGNQGDRWMLNEGYRDVIRQFEGTTHEADELTEASAESEEEMLAEAEEQLEAHEKQLEEKLF